MKRITYYHYIAFLVYKEQTGQLTSDEICLFEGWKSEEDSNRILYERLVAKTDWSEDLRRYEHINTDAAWRKYVERYALPHKKRTAFRNISIVATIAACVLLAVILFRHYPQRDVTTLAHHSELINPGASKAILILDNGQLVDLSTSENREIGVVNNTRVVNTGSLLSYSSNEKNDASPAEAKEIYNTIVVPRAGEYKIILSDGTSIWLNAQTTLKYPVHFSGETRTVYLHGEAYFDVATNKENPFIVVLQNDVAVHAIGTAFNIRSYSAEGKIQTILEEGKVEMQTSEGKYSMLPNMMVEYDKESRKTTLQTVDPELYTAWRQGRYIFLDETLVNIFRRLADWYDIHIVYENEEIKHKRYSGNVMRRGTVNGFLHAIEESGGVRFEIDGRTVRVFPDE